MRVFQADVTKLQSDVEALATGQTKQHADVEALAAGQSADSGTTHHHQL